jgi:PAS domain-containing protein
MESFLNPNDNHINNNNNLVCQPLTQPNVLQHNNAMQQQQQQQPFQTITTQTTDAQVVPFPVMGASAAVAIPTPIVPLPPHVAIMAPTVLPPNLLAMPSNLSGGGENNNTNHITNSSSGIPPPPQQQQQQQQQFILPTDPQQQLLWHQALTALQQQPLMIASLQQFFLNASQQQPQLTLPPQQQQQQQQQTQAPQVPANLPLIAPQQSIKSEMKFPMVHSNFNNNGIASVVSLASGGSNPPPAAASMQQQYQQQQQPIEEEDKPPTIKSEEDLKKMSQAERRRYERNLREQQRSYKISQQIKQLRDVLNESNVPFRPNKYSILLSVAEYIRQLQARAIMLDSEHQRLLDTMRQTNEYVTTGKPIPNSSDEDTVNNNTSNTQYSFAGPIQNINYEAVFQHCPCPLGVATLDGRMLACNRNLEELLGAESGSLAGQSLFLYIRNHQEIFEAMAALLKRSTATIETGEGTLVASQQLLFWCGTLDTLLDHRVGPHCLCVCLFVCLKSG